VLNFCCCANGVVNKNGHAIDDVFLYYTDKHFAWYFLCEGTYKYMLTPIEHELLKQD
jgi:hypothetical protein